MTLGFTLLFWSSGDSDAFILKIKKGMTAR